MTWLRRASELHVRLRLFVNRLRVDTILASEDDDEQVNICSGVSRGVGHARLEKNYHRKT